MTVELTKKYLRIRIADPKRFSKIRTDDIGRKGHSLRLAGINKKIGKWETQAWLIDRKDIEKRDIRVFLLLRDILNDLPKAKRNILNKKVRQLT